MALRSNALTPDRWRALAEGKRVVALKMVEDRSHCHEAWHAAGLAVEFALKGYIMRRERMNRWPDREDRGELYTHDLPALFRIAGIDPAGMIGPIRARLRVVLQWRREYEYVGRTMERRAARSMIDAAFGSGGVVQWLNDL